MSFDRATFYTTIRKGALFDGTLSTRQVTGMEAMLDAFDKSGFTDLRWLAYILGTAYHETGRAMYPVREGGLGKGHPYGVPGADGQVAYGRGLVQLTWAANYAKADKALGARRQAHRELRPGRSTRQSPRRSSCKAWRTRGSRRSSCRTTSTRRSPIICTLAASSTAWTRRR